LEQALKLDEFWVLSQRSSIASLLFFSKIEYISKGPRKTFGASVQASMPVHELEIMTEIIGEIGPDTPQYADPETGQTGTDMDAARQMIHILEMLRDKTDGNLTHEEAELLKSLLYDLRIAYTEATR
jgi:hypothetical protein